MWLKYSTRAERNFAGRAGQRWGEERIGAVVFGKAAAKEAKWERPKYDGDAASRALDAITLEEHYIQHYGMTREFCREFLSPVEGGGSGLGPDALSAYNDFAFEFLYPFDDKSGDPPVQMFPGGNTTIARLMAKTLIPGARSMGRRVWTERRAGE